MFCYTGIKSACARKIVAKKTVLFSFLLIFLSSQSTFLRAQVAESSPLKSEAVTGVKSETGQTENISPSDKQYWSQRSQQREQKVIVPPPPPGPYMSSALSEPSARRFSFNRVYKQPPATMPLNPAMMPLNKGQLNHPAHQNVPKNAPMQTFSPDRPWPENLRPDGLKSADNRMSRKAYHFAQPTARQKPYPLPPKNWPLNAYHQPGNYGPGNYGPGNYGTGNYGHGNNARRYGRNPNTDPNQGIYRGQRPPPVHNVYDGR